MRRMRAMECSFHGVVGSCSVQCGRCNVNARLSVQENGHLQTHRRACETSAPRPQSRRGVAAPPVSSRRAGEHHVPIASTRRVRLASGARPAMIGPHPRVREAHASDQPSCGELGSHAAVAVPRVSPNGPLLRGLDVPTGARGVSSYNGRNVQDFGGRWGTSPEDRAARVCWRCRSRVFPRSSRRPGTARWERLNEPGAGATSNCDAPRPSER